MKEWISSHGKALYRAANACLLACMVLFGAGRFLGIDGFRALHLITALAVLGILAWMNDMTVSYVQGSRQARQAVGISGGRPFSGWWEEGRRPGNGRWLMG